MCDSKVVRYTLLPILILYTPMVYLTCYFGNSYRRISRDYMSFLPSSRNFGRFTRPSVFYRTWLQTRRVHCMSRTAEVCAEFLSKQKIDDMPIQSQPDPPLTFESLGLGVPFLQALQKAFPKVEIPTNIQAQLIPAILGTQDILLKDETGSGK